MTRTLRHGLIDRNVTLECEMDYFVHCNVVQNVRDVYIVVRFVVLIVVGPCSGVALY